MMHISVSLANKTSDAIDQYQKADLDALFAQETRIEKRTVNETPVTFFAGQRKTMKR